MKQKKENIVKGAYKKCLILLGAIWQTMSKEDLKVRSIGRPGRKWYFRQRKLYKKMHRMVDVKEIEN